MPIPSVRKLLNDVMNIFRDGREYRLRDLILELRKNLLENGVVSEDEALERLRSGQRTLDNRIAWAVTHLHVAGLLQRKDRGVYIISEEGKKALRDMPIDLKYLERYPEYKEWIENKKPDLKETSQEINRFESETVYLPKEEILEKLQKDMKTELENELIERLKNIDPYKFKVLVLELLKKMGYGEPETTQKTKDEGIDGVIKADKFGFDEIYIQAKRWKSTVGVEVINTFIGTLTGKGASSGVIITTSNFSRDAEIAVERIRASGMKIVLIDGKRLVNLMIEHNVGVYVKYTYEIKAIDENFFEEV